MANEDDELIPTRASLLGRLKNSKDQASWQEFFDTYSKLIYGVARKAGLSGDEAKGVLEATMDSVAQHLPKFRYDPDLGSFKAWLHKLIRLQIISHTLKPRASFGAAPKEITAAESTPSGQALDQLWETEWKTNLLNAAVANVKRRLDPKKYQIYDFCVNKKWSLEKAATAFSVTADEACEAVESITEMIAAEAKRLEREML
jgi:RNA polymerase sigma factor (sigma-70 family)